MRGRDTTPRSSFRIDDVENTLSIVDEAFVPSYSIVAIASATLRRDLSALLSILVPAYNEQELIAACLQRALAAPLPEGLARELIVVDDGSTDETASVVSDLATRHPEIRLLRHERNQGKGRALQTAIHAAQGEFCLVQDADLEYDPNEWPLLLKPLLERKADAVFGSRFQFRNERRVLYYWHAVGNAILTTVCNMASGLNLTDVTTGYKAFRTSLVQSVPWESSGFSIEPEICIKLAQRGARIYEVPINYNGRTYDEGKKIRLRHAFRMLFATPYYGMRRKIYRDSGPEILDVLAGAPKFNEWMASKVSPYLGKRVAEIGAGIGNLSIHLMRGKKTYYAADLDEEHLARLRVRFEGRQQFHEMHCDVSRWEDVAPLEGKVDSVVSLNVIEHVEDDRGSFRNLYRILPEGGCAVILVPQDQRIYTTLDEVLGHFRRYSAAELREKMEAAGFHIETMFEFNRMARPGWWWNGKILKRRTFSRFQIAGFDSLVWLWKAIDNILPWPGVSLIAVGRKRA